MAVNKVVYGNNTLMDITDTTATTDDVANGKVFYSASGTRTVGTASGGSGGIPILSGDVYVQDLEDGVYYLTSGSTVYTTQELEDVIVEIEAGGTLIVNPSLDLSSSGVTGKSYFLINHISDFEYMEDYATVNPPNNQLYSGTIVEESGDWMTSLDGKNIEYLLDSFKINNVKVSSGGMVNLMTEGTYNQSTNKIVTKSYVDDLVGDVESLLGGI